MKLIEGKLNATRTMEALAINTEWSPGGETDAAKRVPVKEGSINIFESNKASKEAIEEYSNLVWADTDFGASMPKYFMEFDIAPADKASLDALRNKQKQKHVMLGNKIWNSLSSPFKSEIIGSKMEFKRVNEYDDLLLWDFICRRINPSTTVGASKLKDEIENIKPAQFENNIIK